MDSHGAPLIFYVRKTAYDLDTAFLLKNRRFNRNLDRPIITDLEVSKKTIMPVITVFFEI